MNLIGIGGTNGSGKDSLGDFLAKEHGWLFVSVSDILRDGLKAEGSPIEREHLRELSTRWRREQGHGVLIDKAFKLFEGQQNKYKGLAIASLRNPGEAQEVHRLGGLVVWIDGDPKVRYDRIYNRGRSAEDNKSYKEFLAEEKAEMAHHKGDDTTLSLSGVKTKADIFINNDQNDLKIFQAQAAKALGLSSGSR